jgi:hypothetical protein
MHLTNPLEQHSNNSNENQGLSLDEFQKMSLKDIANYFDKYAKLKAFCAKLTKVTQKNKVVLITDNDIIKSKDADEVKQNLLNYMRLPTTTDSKDPVVIKRYSTFASAKPQRLMITLTIFRTQLNNDIYSKQNNDNDNEMHIEQDKRNKLYKKQTKNNEKD